MRDETLIDTAKVHNLHDVQALYTQTEIARTIEVHKSTVSREISRNSDGRSHKYRDDLAQRKADKRARSKQHHVRLTEEIKGLITSYLCEVEAERGWPGRS